MNEAHTENGHINDNGEEELDQEGLHDALSPDINSPRHYGNPKAVDHDHPSMEYFEPKREGSPTGSEEGEGPLIEEKDNDSHNFVTVSPSISPGE